METSIVFSLFCGGYLLSFGSCLNDDEVELTQGIAKGYLQTSYKGRQFLAFEGIPYAKPPVGDLRFAEPEPAEKWEGILEANRTYTCAHLLPIQMIWGPMGTEDCLYLYVYVPEKTINEKATYPVVVHIHGGAFMMGSPKMMALPDFMMDRDVIYVTINYRLGILGFMSTEDDVVPGNMGLKDQTLALKWIKDNIQHFGGNPESITLTGESAGAASVHYHYLSPGSRGLFNRGLSQSGTALQSWALAKNPLQKAKFVARNVSCDTGDTKEMLACLRTKDYKEMLVGIAGLFVLMDGLPAAPFGPVVEKGGDTPFINEHPYKILEEGNNVYDVPWINSNTQDEGIIPVNFLVHYKKIDKLAEEWNTILPAILDMNDTVDNDLKPDVAQKLKNFYFGDEGLTYENVDNFVKLCSDRLFFVDSELATRMHTKAVKSPVYYYIFKFIPSGKMSFGKMKKGAYHGSDGMFMYRWIISPKLKENEEKVMEMMTKFLQDYAVSGVPDVNGVEWFPIDPLKEEIEFLGIEDPDNVKMDVVRAIGPNDFWKSLPLNENQHLFH